MVSDKNNRNKNYKSKCNTPFPAYDGDDSYIFICYSHDDAHLVYPELERFHNDGYNIWYDEGIISGDIWHEVVERALINSSLIIAFMSNNSVESDYVEKELLFAIDEGIPVFQIFLEECKLPDGLNMYLISSPSLSKYEMDEKKYVSMYRSHLETNGFELNTAHSLIDEYLDNPPFPAYNGDERYMFISYSHKDAHLVYPELERFHNDGYNIWYDEGIVSGTRWQEEVEKTLINSSLFIVFISRNSVASKHVTREILSAVNKIEIIPIYLEPTKLTGHGLGLNLRLVQSIYKHKMGEDRYIEQYRKAFSKNGFEVKPKDSPTSQPEPAVEKNIETECLIKLIEEKIPNLDEETQNDFYELVQQYVDSLSTKNEELLDSIHLELKSIFEGIYVEEYLETIKNTPILGHPSFRLQVDESTRYEIIKATFSKLEQSTYNNKNNANELIRLGHRQKDDNDIKGLEKTVIKLYNESQIPIISENSKQIDEKESQKDIESEEHDCEIIHDSKYLNEFEEFNISTNTIYDLGDLELLIILNDGTNLTKWDEVDNKEDILYVSEDLSGHNNLTGRYKNLKSLKAIVVTNLDDDVTNMKEMFAGCSSLEDISSLKYWKTEKVGDMNGMFKGCSSLKDISSLKNWDTSNVEDLNGIFDGCTSLNDISALKDWDVGNVADISGMFYDCSSLTDIFPLKNWNTENVKYMSRVFRGCSSLKDVLSLKDWNMDNVTDINSTFKGCESLFDIFSLKNWNIINIKDLSGLFYNCLALEDISSLKNWKTKNVSDMNSMFRGCTSLKDISALKDWKTGNVVDMNAMFYDCSSLMDVFPLKNWDTKKTKDMSMMFYNCSSLENASALNNWSVTKVDIKEMFEGCNDISEIPEWYNN